MSEKQLKVQKHLLKYVAALAKSQCTLYIYKIYSSVCAIFSPLILHLLNINACLHYLAFQYHFVTLSVSFWPCRCFPS